MCTSLFNTYIQPQKHHIWKPTYICHLCVAAQGYPKKWDSWENKRHMNTAKYSGPAGCACIDWPFQTSNQLNKWCCKHASLQRLVPCWLNENCAFEMIRLEIKIWTGRIQSDLVNRSELTQLSSDIKHVQKGREDEVWEIGSRLVVANTISRTHPNNEQSCTMFYNHSVQTVCNELTVSVLV